MGEHTKGPWLQHEDYPRVVVAAAEPTTSLLALDMTDGTEEDPIAIIASDADARLIAAAPELLAALLRLVQSAEKAASADDYCAHCDCHPRDGHARGCPISEATRAIAKARGTR